MNKASTYLASLFLSVLLVFGILGSAVLTVTHLSINRDKAIELSQENALEQKVYDYLDKYYKDKYNTSGIPAEVYMEAIDVNWLRELIENSINDGFEALEGQSVPKHKLTNNDLEKNIRDFLSDYADKSGVNKDSKYEKQVDKVVENAYDTIQSACDVFKIRSLQQHGVLSKLSRIFSNIPLALAVISSTTLVLILILMLVNRKDTAYVLYWTGISAVIGGIIGIAPCAYLLITKYYNSFSIKQPQIYTAYTSAMYGYTSTVTATMIAVIVIGIAIMILYSVAWGFKQQSNEINAIKKTKN